MTCSKLFLFYIEMDVCVFLYDVKINWHYKRVATESTVRIQRQETLFAAERNHGSFLEKWQRQLCSLNTTFA